MSCLKINELFVVFEIHPDGFLFIIKNMGILNSVFKTFHKIVNGGKDVLEPVEGIGFEDWVKANAKLAGGKKPEELITQMGIDMPRWDRINNEFLTRMKNDRSFTMSVKYASIFNNAAEGNLPKKKEFTENTFSLEKYAEVMAAMEFLGKQGRDAQDILKDFGLTVVDYSNLGSYWGKKIAFSPFGTGMRFQSLLMEYRGKYEKAVNEGGAHRDIQF